MERIPEIVLARMVRESRDNTHPNADLLAAFAEQALKPAERSQVLQHLSCCRDCRNVVVMGWTPVETGVVVKTASGWFRWPAMRWAVAAACVAVVGSAIGLHEFGNRQSLSTQTMIVNDAGHRFAPPIPQSPPAPVPVAAEPQLTISHAQKPAPHLPTQTVRRHAPPEIPIGKAKISPAAVANEALIVVVPPVTEIPSSGVAPRWTLAEDGLQRSLDGGMTWQGVAVACACKLRALATVGAHVWVAGSHGALYHSSDAGEHWNRVFASGMAGPVATDIVGVEFTDPEHGKITTASRQVWTTSDSGDSWQEQ
jgi:hypothetical protein